MIIEYQRPKTEADAIALIKRSQPKTVPLGGGTVLSKTKEVLAVVDLQNLGWNKIDTIGGHTVAGSMVTLEALLRYFGSDSTVGRAIAIDAGKNIRDMATLGGTLVSIDGRSALLTALLAANIELVLKPGDQTVGIDHWFDSRSISNECRLIHQVRFPKVESLVFESVGRSPLDQPILCCFVAKLPGNRLRIAFGGFGEHPTLAFDGDANQEYSQDVEIALAHSDDQWATAEYRLETGKLLAKRLVAARE